MLLKRFLILSSGGTPVLWSRTIYAILEEGIMGENSCEVILNLDQWFRRCLKKKFTDNKDGSE